MITFFVFLFGLWLGAILMLSYMERDCWRIWRSIICGIVAFASYAVFNYGQDMDTASAARRDAASLIVTIGLLGLIVAILSALLLPFWKQNIFDKA